MNSVFLCFEVFADIIIIISFELLFPHCSLCSVRFMSSVLFRVFLSSFSSSVLQFFSPRAVVVPREHFCRESVRAFLPLIIGCFSRVQSSTTPSRTALLRTGFTDLYHGNREDCLTIRWSGMLCLWSLIFLSLDIMESKQVNLFLAWFRSGHVQFDRSEVT